MSPGEPPSRGPLSKSRGRKARRGARILVVADDEETRHTLTDMLAASGFQVSGCEGGAEALKRQGEYAPVVAVIDDALGDTTGVELAGALKGRDPELLALLLTERALLEPTAGALGALDAYLVEPVAANALTKVTFDLLERRNLVAENRDLAARLERLTAYPVLYDPLTRLPNRALLEDRLAQALASCRRSGGMVAALFVDLDSFKEVNDLFGHDVGDQLLRQLADRMAGPRRASDSVARFGGDEFVVVCPDMKSSAMACRIAERLLRQLSAPSMVEGVEHRLSVSIGVALSEPGSRNLNPTVLLRDADRAMYRAKELGGGTWELFDETLRERVEERLRIEQALRAGLTRGELVLAYQPIIDLSTGRAVGAEALVRWDRPGQGVVRPASFLAAAEESGLVGQLDRWVLDRALRDLAEAKTAGEAPDPFRLWVNVSAQQLADPEFAEFLREFLAEYGIAASSVRLDLVHDGRRTKEGELRHLRELGVSVNLEDFGTGTFDLSSLEQPPINGFKIQQRFVSLLGGADDERGEGIVRGLLDLGHALGLSVVAQGVETAAQAQALRRMGCELAQGYHFAHPGTVEQLWAFVREGVAGITDGASGNGRADAS